MKNIIQNLKDLFLPRNMQDIDAHAILSALGDPVVLKFWLFEMLSEIKRINLEVDRRTLTGADTLALSARRRELQFMLETALSIKRDIQRTRGHNPAQKGEFDLDAVTVGPGIR